jgi:hypothetical protein
MKSHGWFGCVTVLLVGVVVLFHPGGTCFCQDESAPMTVHPTPLGLSSAGCLEIGLTAMRQLPRLFQAGEVDSVYTWLERWEQACGPVEPVLRGKILADIWTGSFHESDVDHATLDLLLEWPQTNKEAKSSADSEGPPSWHTYWQDMQDQQLTYDAFTSWLAVSLQPRVVPGSSAQLVCDHYAGTKELTGQVRRKPYTHTRLREVFMNRVWRERKRLHTVWGFYAGGASSWQDQHRDFSQSLVGLRYGIQLQNTWLRAVLEGGGTTEATPLLPDSLLANVTDRWNYSDHRVALEIGLDLASSWRHTLGLGFGLGYGTRFYRRDRHPSLKSHSGETLKLKYGQTYFILGYGYHFGRWGDLSLGFEMTVTSSKFALSDHPERFEDDFSLRMVFTKHELRLPGG